MIADIAHSGLETQQTQQRRKPGIWLRCIIFTLPLFAGVGPYAAIPPGHVGPLYIYRIYAAILFVTALVTLIRFAVPTSAASKLAMFTAGVYLIWPWATTFWAPNPDLGSKEAFSAIFPMLVLVSVVYLIQVYESLLRLVLWGFVFAMLMSFLVVIFDVVSGTHFIAVMGGDWIFPPGVATSFFGNPNNYACFLISCSALLISLMLVVKNQRVTWALGAGVMVILGFEFITGSRSGLLGTGLLLVLLYVLHGFKTGFRTLPAAVMSISCISVIVGLFAHEKFLKLAEGVFGQLYSANSSNADSDAFRAKLSETAFSYFIDSGLMGKGAGSFIPLISKERTFANNPKIEVHNTLLEIASQYGVIMLAPLLAIFAVAAYQAFRRTPVGATHEIREERYFYRILSGALLITVVLYSLVVSSTFLDPYWWLLVTMLLVGANRVSVLEQRSERHV